MSVIYSEHAIERMTEREIGGRSPLPLIEKFGLHCKLGSKWKTLMDGVVYVCIRRPNHVLVKTVWRKGDAEEANLQKRRGWQ